MRALALLVLVLGACGRDVEPPRPAGPTMSPAAYAAVTADLAIARAQLLPDTAAYRARRDEILARQGVTVQDLRDFVRGYGANEDVMQAVFRAVQRRLDAAFGTPGAAPAADDTAPAAEPAPQAPS